MIRSRLFREIVLPYAIFALALAVGLVWVDGAVYEHAAYTGLVRRLEATARSVAVRRDVFLSPPEQWQPDLDRLARASGVRLTVIDGSGTAIADTAGEATSLSKLLNRPEV